MAFDGINILKIDELTAFAKRVQVSFKVMNKGELREITSRRSGETHNLCDIEVADSTGSIILTLWDDDIDLVEEGKDYTLSNGYVNVFHNSMRLSKGKYGELSDAEEAIEDTKTDNNLSDRHTEVQRPYRRYDSNRFSRDRNDRRRGGYDRFSDRNRSGW
ncbi:MAG: hypothetical protein ACFFBD_18350 [Candidatus Hodarchaeota archaeon]